MSVLSVLQHVFPPPQYMTLPSAGIDISDTSLKYVRFTRSHSRDKNLTLAAWGDIDVPEGTVVDGDIVNVAQMIPVLKEARERAGTVHARISLPEERAYIFETTVRKDTSLKEIRGLLEFKLEENVPLSPRDALFDYDIVEDTENENVLRVIVAVYGKDTILKYYEACVGAGIVPISFEVEAQSIARATVPRNKVDTAMIVDFGKTRTGIGIVHRGMLMYTSTIDVGGQELSHAMREVLGEKSEAELTQIKNEHGLNGIHGNEATRKVLTDMIERIVTEVQARMHYWHTRDIDKGRREIKEVILCGGSVNLAGLPEYLTRRLGLETRRAEVWENAFSIESFVPPIDKRHSYGYATAIGLALADFSDI